MLKPYPHQIKPLQVCLEILNSKKPLKEIVVAPTGFGKSILTALTTKEINFPVIILQPSKELVRQNYSKFKLVGGQATVCCASLKEFTRKKRNYFEIDGEEVLCDEISNVTFATIGSVIKRWEEFKKLGVQHMIYDECFPFQTPILTSEGTKWIGDIDKMISDGKEVKVKSWNSDRNIFEYKNVVASKNMGVKKTIKVFYGVNNTVECTPDHKFLTLDGWKEAVNLKLGDALISSELASDSKSLDVLNQDQEDLMVGNSLGDGCLDYRSVNSFSARLKMVHGDSQKEYLNWKADMFNCIQSINTIDNNGYSNKIVHRVNTKTFYLKEKYKNYEYQISKLNFKSLAVLWMDDGCLSKKNNAGTLYALCNDRNLVVVLNEKIKELGIRGTEVRESISSSTKRKLWFINLKKQSVEDISRECAKYIHESLAYKLIPEYRSLAGTYDWDNSFKNVVRVFKKSEQSIEQEVFDIEVEDNHNFIITSKSAYKYGEKNAKKVVQEGIVVHNCQLASKPGSQTREFIDKVKIKNILGLTATPIYLSGGMYGATLKMMNRVRSKLFKDIAHVTQIQELVKKEFWSKLNYKVMDTDETFLKENSNGSDFTVQSQKDYYKANDLNSQIIEEIDLQISEGRKSILVFLPTIEEAEALKFKYPSAGIVHSKTSYEERKNYIDGFKNLSINVMFNINVLSVGFDHPRLDCIISTRPTASMAIYYQQLGRGVRIHELKENCNIVDFSGNVKRFGRVEGLTFEKLPGYGWGMFNEREELLTDYPISAKVRPTKKLLINSSIKNAELEKNKIQKGIPIFNFGKYKGKNLKDLIKSPKASEVKNYCAWIVDKHQKGDWKFYGNNAKVLEDEIYKFLKLR